MAAATYAASSGGGATTTADNAKTFSRANVFALFLTLALCLIVQPGGSVLYSKPRATLGRVIFFFWRLNPLACAMEAVLITFALADGTWSALTGRWQPAELGFWGQLQTTALATLLLRGHGDLPLHWSAIPEADSDYPGMSQHSVQREPLLQAHWPGFRQLVTGSDDAMSNTNSPDVDFETGVTGTEESNSHPIDTPMPSLVSANVNRRLPLHAELIIDIAGTVGVAITITKLASVVIPLHLAIPVWCLVSGWAAVQLLVLASHRRTSGSAKPEHLISRALGLKRKLRGSYAKLFFTVLLVPLFGYLTFVMLFRTSALPPVMSFVYHEVYYVFFIAIDPTCWKLIPGWIHSCFGRREKTRVGSFELGRRAPSFELAFSDTLPFENNSSANVVANTAYFVIRLSLFALLGYWLSELINRCLVLGLGSVSWAEVYLPFLVTICMMWAWFIHPMTPLRGRGRGFAWIQGLCLFYNLVTTGFFFAGAMMMYDDAGTHKPEWLEWLGKLKRGFTGQFEPGDY